MTVLDLIIIFVFSFLFIFAFKFFEKKIPAIFNTLKNGRYK